MTDTEKHPATAHDIISILGPIDEETVTAIGHIRATRVEIQRAKAWLDDCAPVDSYLRKNVANIRIQRVYDILADERDRYETDEAG